MTRLRRAGEKTAPAGESLSSYRLTASFNKDTTSSGDTGVVLNLRMVLRSLIVWGIFNLIPPHKI